MKEAEKIQDAGYWIRGLEMKPHPEGGFYKEVFRSNQEINRIHSDVLKNACTSIYYLLEGNDFSAFHRLSSDEIWYFHKGSPLVIYILDKQGLLARHELSDLETGHLSQVVEAGLWFAAYIPSGSGFSLVSCAVAPGFDFSDFEMADKEELIRLYPSHLETINQLCR